MTDLVRALDALAQHGATIRPHQVDAVIKAIAAARREGAEAALEELEDALRREIAIGRREGAEAEREEWMSCATADGLAVKALTIARSKGAEEMRERAAQLVEDLWFDARDTEWDEGVNCAKRRIAAAIRALKAEH